MELDHDACYRALVARDARFDGRFFTAVKTTGIYCRPICPARPPKSENCIFMPSAAAAQAAGFRPCLRCRPESSPDLGAWRGTSATVSRAMALVESGALDGSAVADLAARLGLGERQLRRLFRRHLGASPVAVAQTRRVLLAKKLIHETDLPMTDVALASGFGSVRRFNETFRQLYDRPPGALRRRREAGADPTAIVLTLPYRPPYDWAGMLGFLAARAIPGVEAVADGTYRRTVALDGAVGTLAVTHAPERNALTVAIRLARLDCLPAFIARIRRVFDLGAEPAAIAAGLSPDPALRPLIEERPGLRVPGAFDGFEVAVRAVLGQQITVGAATRLAGKLVQAFGEALAGADDDGAAHGLTHVFPSPERLARADIASLGMPRARAAAIAGLAQAAAVDPLLFHPRRDLEATIMRLRALPGIGEWTAQYIAMRGLRETDAFPAADVGLMRAMADAAGRRPTPDELLARADAWRPWRAYAALHLWAAGTAAATRSTETRRTDHVTDDRPHSLPNRNDAARLGRHEPAGPGVRGSRGASPRVAAAAVRTVRP
jgi:AraC family transcriptional regulator of adaptative response / DNA-3-methyladenine glycosylase II